MSRHRRFLITISGLAVLLAAARGTVDAKVTQLAPNSTAQCLTWTPFLSAGGGVDERRGIVALSPTDIWTVGATADPLTGFSATQITHGDGTTWRNVPSPNPGKRYNSLDSIAAVTPNDVWAVGNVADGSSNIAVVDNRAVLIHWNGATWQEVPQPNLLPPSSSLTKIATAGGHVWAVGYVDEGYRTGRNKPLILQWDGQQWRRDTVPAVAASAGLYGVSAVSSTDAWAVGATEGGHDLILHWDGTMWSQVNRPAADGYFALNTVSASGPNDLWIAGSADYLPVVLHWDGQSWTRTRLPGLQGYADARLAGLSDILALTPADVWIVGANNGRMLLFHWDGHAWATVSDPLREAKSSRLNAITAVGGEVWAAGAAVLANGHQFGEGVTLHYGRGPCGYWIFAETGQAVYEPFLSYWAGHGALTQQGFPLTEAHPEPSATDGHIYQTQYFERAVFEQHPENAPPYDILLSLLGVEAYSQRYGTAGAPGQHVNPDRARRFPATGHTVGGDFRLYWEAHGGLAQQGYPISEEFAERNALNGQTYTVQYFQRAVFEYHPENAGTPYVVLLSQLGRFAAQRRGLLAP